MVTLPCGDIDVLVEGAPVGRGVILGQAGLEGRLCEEEDCQEGDQAGCVAGGFGGCLGAGLAGQVTGHTKGLNLDVKIVY